MELENYTLPEFAFLDAHAHEGDLLKGRTVIQHIRSYTVMEAVALDDISMSDFQNPSYEFEYKNFLGETEKHLLIVHFSLAWEKPLPVNDTLLEIFKKTAKWYCDYMEWEDKNLKQ